MASIKISCPSCGRMLLADEKTRAKRFKCPHCKELIPARPAPVRPKSSRKWRRNRNKILGGALGFFLLVMAISAWLLMIHPARVRWPDRRPIGTLFLASHFYASATNPRGWFNEPSLDVIGPGGAARFKKALMAYTDRSLAILKRTGAQGVIVWDLEGEQFPHKTTYIGDPRLLARLAPEMAAVADEFFARLRHAGLRVGLTIRPQQIVFDAAGEPHQTRVFDTERLLLEKIDYARKRWGATLFYVDSTAGIFRPDEVWQLRRVAELRPDILLIPEHHWLPYSAFSAPYIALRGDGSSRTADWAQKLFPGSFRALNIGDASIDETTLTAARLNGDVLLFRAWFWNPDCQLLENSAHADDHQ